VKQRIAKLVELADKGIDGGPAELYSTVALATEWLTWLCKKKPELFIGIARQKFYWPLMCNLHSENIRENAELLEKVTLGGETQINLSGKTFSWDVPANRVAVSLHGLARSLERKPISQWIFPKDSAKGLVSCGLRRSPNGSFYHRYNEKYKKRLRALERWGQRGAGRRLPPLSKETAAQWAKATVDCCSSQARASSRFRFDGDTLACDDYHRRLRIGFYFRDGRICCNRGSKALRRTGKPLRRANNSHDSVRRKDLTRIRRQFVIYFLLHRGKCPVKGGRLASPLGGLFEIASVLVRLDHVARFIVNAHHSFMWLRAA
jgi:hypothetical protein